MDLPPTPKGTTKLSIYKELFLPLSRTYGTRMIFFSILITALYCLLIGALYIGWRRIPEVEKIYSEPEKRFSVIIPYRNEAQNLPGLFLSLSKIVYPEELFEIILIDDESGDDSEPLCISFKEDHPHLRVKLLNNLRKTNSPKKDAINEGIKYSQYEYIITTDADCVVGELWLNHFNNSLVKSGASFIAGLSRLSSFKRDEIFSGFSENGFYESAGSGGRRIWVEFAIYVQWCKPML
ncbi:glycosyltransferase [Antarcticibacterium sp. 1MA-6-2]|uniref:glycosyltransferase n=1 Tax=Antarcticibacterium sp. 1MA-6-2 TaxID=2908210 RepID=UPI001F454395|nr:glycosyltransferase [Antarcticibacterium sp. 1MA-6-2]UJH90816.1 glycosyltransferase [Antarcticibacterium sp. 1MA-6-2]